MSRTDSPGLSLLPDPEPAGDAAPAAVTRRPARTNRIAGAVAAVDLLMITVATLAAIRFRLDLPLFDPATDVIANTAQPAIFLIAAWLLLLVMLGAYDNDLFGAGMDEFRLVVNASLANAALVGVGAFLTQSPLSRALFVLLFSIGIPLLLMGRLGARHVLQRARTRGLLSQRVLLVGTPGHVSEINVVLNRERWLGYDVVGCLLPSDYAGIQSTSGGIPVLGTTDDLREHVDDHEVDIVVFTAGAVESSTELRRLAWDLEDHSNVEIIVAPNVTDVSSERVRIRPVAGLPLMHLGRPRSRAARSAAKRAFDVAGAWAVLVLFGPVLLAMMLWIRLDDGGPGMFRQTRVGRDGKSFQCLKLRSMVVDAEGLLPAGDESSVLYKMANDPRVTRPGRFIRRFSLDELPQLWNVVRGEMSLVGPRPPLPDEVARYEDDMLRRLNVLPGMTGLWQVSGRSDLTWEDTVLLDLYYVDNWSMTQDVAILFRTVWAVLASRGAY
ncbi:MAG: Exopolysaccharide biosynthesis polyprenyl glycosylphosphotransferase [Nocardioides sp.]|uniref:sugar transferase n=1 Tax=Nocardioides sp. TaxID=35761 RepID=UPI00261710F2|nr:sugar transferase [Nocardioides sp.]MCW2835760.1 Exopolysaccharide biosynthesis polyprenyl glycosylphosphotransferase [Nocardioides sp.]